MDKKIEYNMKYNKKHYVRVPLDIKVSEYNALKEFCKEQEIGVNTFFRDYLAKALPSELLKKHENDIKKEG